jgi:Tol biopolymer transport system component
MSADGRYVAFVSPATNLVPGDTNRRPDAFVRDRATGTTVRVDVRGNGGQARGGFDGVVQVALSADGRVAAFESDATDLVPNDTNDERDVFVHVLSPTP